MPAPCGVPVRLFMVAMRTYFSAMMAPGWKGRGQRRLLLPCFERLADAMWTRWRSQWQSCICRVAGGGLLCRPVDLCMLSREVSKHPLHPSPPAAAPSPCRHRAGAPVRGQGQAGALVLLA